MKWEFEKTLVFFVILGLLAGMASLYRGNQALAEKVQELESEPQVSSATPMISTPVKKAEPVAEPETQKVQKSKNPAEELPVLVPKIAAEPQVYSFGTIRKSDGPVSTSIRLKNEGRAALNIRYAFASCGCTAIDIEDVTLLPGESKDFDVVYDPSYLGEHYDLGQVEKTVTILSNDPKNTFYTIKLQANVIK